MKNGFTLIELMVAVIIFAIISTISYRVISSLVTTKEIVTKSQAKWGGISLIMNRLEMSRNRALPLPIRDNDGNLLPSMIGKNKLDGAFDAQLEMTLSGNIGDNVMGSTPPKRIGFRFYQGSLYLVSWPVLNRVVTTKPDIDLLVADVSNFTLLFLYPDKKWNDTWPPASGDKALLPAGIQMNLQLKSGESVTRELSL